MVYTPRITWDQLLRTPAQQLVLYSGKTTWWTTRAGLRQVDPAGNRVLRLRWEDFLAEAQGASWAYGKHGLLALAAAHHGNVTHFLSRHPAAVDTWDNINLLLDHHQAGLHPQLQPRTGPAALNMTRDQLTDFLLREGYQPCDIPTCNCGSWHGGPLQEIREALGDRVQGKTILQAVQELLHEDV